MAWHMQGLQTRTCSSASRTAAAAIAAARPGGRPVLTVGDVPQLDASSLLADTRRGAGRVGGAAVAACSSTALDTGPSRLVKTSRHAPRPARSDPSPFRLPSRSKHNSVATAAAVIASPTPAEAAAAAIPWPTCLMTKSSLTTTSGLKCSTGLRSRRARPSPAAGLDPGAEAAGAGASAGFASVSAMSWGGAGRGVAAPQKRGRHVREGLTSKEAAPAAV
eukprot:228450-Chlamydomonas_euryale.AAC.10